MPQAPQLLVTTEVDNNLPFSSITNNEKIAITQPSLSSSTPIESKLIKDIKETFNTSQSKLPHLNNSNNNLSPLTEAEAANVRKELRTSQYSNSAVINHTKSQTKSQTASGSHSSQGTRESTINPSIETTNIFLDEKPFISYMVTKYKNDAFYSMDDLSTANDPQKKLSGFVISRNKKLISSVLKMTESGSTLVFKDRKKKLITKFDYCATGEEIFKWFLNLKGGGYMSNEEVCSHLQYLMEYGYLINPDFETTFTADQRLYTLQSPLLWHRDNWKPSEEDYVTYLVRREKSSGERLFLKPYENDRLMYFKSKLKEKWDTIEIKVATQKVYFDKLSKSEQRKFNVQEFGFWQYFCPDPANSYLAKDKKIALEMERDAGKKGCSADVFEQQLNGELLLKYLIQKINFFTHNLTLNFKKSSSSSKTIITHCDLFLPTDPMILGFQQNPWLKNDALPAKVERKTASVYDVRIWVNNFLGLLRDPLGFAVFSDFIASEHSTENLNFWLKVEELEKLAENRVDFTAGALEIYKNFISCTAPEEINIPSHIKNVLHTEFLEDNIHKLPYNCFREAQFHIQTLMMNDSFPRFCSSDILANYFLNNVKDKHKFKGSLNGCHKPGSVMALKLDKNDRSKSTISLSNLLASTD
ncbi:Regulator of G-protein signaling 7 [Lobulomyces angularis]|nr:Regulator of G-protein signaling 7 [Lobulomyces angularis]